MVVAFVYCGTDYECSGDLFVVSAIFKKTDGIFLIQSYGDVFFQETANQDNFVKLKEVQYELKHTR